MNIAIEIGRRSSEETKAAERSLVIACGGQVFQDEAGNSYAVFSPDNLDNAPISKSARLFEIVSIPDGWTPIGTA